MALLRLRHSLGAALLAGALCCTVVSRAGAATTQEVSDYEIKAAMLVQISKFVEWPAETFPGPASLFGIGVVGDDPFGEILDRLAAGQTVSGHPIVVKRYKTMLDVGADVHMLFVSGSETSRLSKLKEPLFPAGILMVGDAHAFAQRIGTIGFVQDGDRIRFEINVGTAERCRLKISSKLLTLARTIVNNSSEAGR